VRAALVATDLPVAREASAAIGLAARAALAAEARVALVVLGATRAAQDLALVAAATDLPAERADSAVTGLPVEREVSVAIDLVARAALAATDLLAAKAASVAEARAGLEVLDATTVVEAKAARVTGAADPAASFLLRVPRHPRPTVTRVVAGARSRLFFASALTSRLSQCTML